MDQTEDEAKAFASISRLSRSPVGGIMETSVTGPVVEVARLLFRSQVRSE